MKRTISMLLVLALALSIFPVTAGAVSSGLNILDTPRTYATYDETEDNDYMSAADRFDADQAQVYGEVGSIADGDTADWFAFTISGPRRLYLYGISGAGGYGTTSFSLMGTDGGVIRHANQLGVSEYGDDVFEFEIDLEPGTYYIRVTDSYYWVEYGFATTLTPLLPTPRVTASNRSTDGKIQLSWNAITGAGCYYILRADNELFICPNLFYSTGTTYTDTSAVAGVTYHYKIYASSSDPGYLNSMYSRPVSRTCDLPRPAGMKSVRSAATGKVTVSWNAVPGADKYNVYCSDGTGYTLLQTVTGTSLTHTDAVLGKTYNYKVKALKNDVSAATSAYSPSVKGTALCAAPVLTLSNVASTGKIRVTWTAVAGAKSYQLYKSSDGVNWTKATTTVNTAITHSSTNAGELWYYKVKALGLTAGTDSAFSDSGARTCDLARPTLSIGTNSKGKPRITWNAVPGAVQYKIYLSTDGVNWSLAKTMTGTSLTHTSAQKGVTYYYKVAAAAANSAADSACSAVRSMTSG